MKKRLIEYNIPLADISEESAKEKNIRHGHPSTLHIWWARRPLAASRATAFAALIDDPGPNEPAPEGSKYITMREYLQDFIKKITPWDAVKDGNSQDIQEARNLIHKQFKGAPKVLDPFAGGGSIPLEAIRLGCETYASDYNPLAVFIEKATLEWPQKFGKLIHLPKKELLDGYLKQEQLPLSENNNDRKVNLLSYLVEKWANKIFIEAKNEIGQFYPYESAEGLIGKREIKHYEGWIPVGYLWARTITCQNPNCEAQIPLIKQFWLSKKNNKKIAYRPIVNKINKELEFEILQSEKEIKSSNFNPDEGTISRANAKCPVCGQILKANKIRKIAQDGGLGERMIAVVFHHPKQFGKRYRLATKKDKDLFLESSEFLLDKLSDWPYLESPLPNEEIPLMSGVFNVPIYGLDQWQKLFNNRQKLSLITFQEKIKGIEKEIRKNLKEDLPYIEEMKINIEELSKAILGYLAIIFDR